MSCSYFQTLKTPETLTTISYLLGQRLLLNPTFQDFWTASHGNPQVHIVPANNMKSSKKTEIPNPKSSPSLIANGRE